MRFAVVGANKHNGDDVRVEIDAPTEADAITAASAKGILVERCERLAVSDQPDALKDCPFCGERIKAKAIKCRYCKESLNATSSAHSPPPLPNHSAQQPSPTAEPNRPPRLWSADWYKEDFARASKTNVSPWWLLAIPAGIIVMFLISGSGNSKPTGASYPPVSGTTFAKFDSKFSIHSQTTDVQKEQLMQEFKGQRVRWQGIIDDVSDDIVYLKHKSSTMTRDVALHVADSDSGKLSGLHKGDLLTYEGTINDYGALLSHDLRDGIIVDTKALTGDERLTWLLHSEADALQPIADEIDKR